VIPRCRDWRQSLALVLLATHAMSILGGCARWEPQPLVPQAVIDRQHPERLRVTRTDSSLIELQRPRIENDSLKGLSQQRPASVPLGEVAYVSLRRNNSLPVILAVSLGLAVGAFVLVAATYND